MVVEMWGLGRIVSTPDRVWNSWIKSAHKMLDDNKEAEGVQMWVEFLHNVTSDLGAGLRVEELNLDEEQLLRLNQRNKDVAQLLERMTGATGTVTIPFVRKEFKRKSKTIDEAFEEAFGE